MPSPCGAPRRSPAATSPTAAIPYICTTTTDGTVLYALHPPPPISSVLTQARIAYLHDTAARIAAEPRALVVGDLNSSPYSPHYRDFLHTSGTTATTRHFTLTWRPLFLNLDHALVKNLDATTTPLP
ncbi:endonuclease/exonuclease/phosphatase family protein [Dentiradicibacter hellwigii]|uniref:Endonuclease/exonuclease/phosphatase family protein n=1 Tax=Dentiradicibacter hellwigii TaxID=3149053 RepID=A0ABV4UEQ5_9RHOO